MGKIKRWLYGNRKPTDAEAIVLRAWATELAEHYEMDADWIGEVLKATIPHEPIWESEADRVCDGAELLRWFRPSLLEALEAFLPEDVVEIFSDKSGAIPPERLNLLQWREQDFRSILRSPLPLQRLSELEHNSGNESILSKFGNYLDSERGDFLNNGRMTKSFPESEWLCHFFGGPEPKPVPLDHEMAVSPDISQPPSLSSVRLILSELKSVPKGTRIPAQAMDAAIDSMFSAPSVTIGTTKAPAIEIGDDGLENRPVIDPVKQIKSTKLGRMLWFAAQERNGGFVSDLRISTSEAELEEKIHEQKMAAQFRRKETELRESIFNFIKKSYVLFTTAINKRASNQNANLEQSFLDELWILLVEQFSPEQLDILTGKSLVYFELPLEKSKNLSWSYSSPCLRVFRNLSLFAQDIGGQIMNEVRENLDPLFGEVFDDDLQHFKIPNCTYYQALYFMRGTDSDLDQTILKYSMAHERGFEIESASRTRILTAHQASAARRKQLTEALEDMRAAERLFGRRGFFVNTEQIGNRVQGRRRIPGPYMEEGCAAFHPKDESRKPLIFKGIQKAAVRVLYEASQSKTGNGGADKETIIRAIYLDDKEREDQLKKLYSKVKGETWRIENSVFSRHEAWKEGFIYSFKEEGAEREDTIYYALNFHYDEKSLKKKRRPNGERKKELEEAKKNVAQAGAHDSLKKKNIPRVSAKADKSGSKKPAKRSH
jgi:hypothetical protein